VVAADINLNGIPAFAEGGSSRQALDVQFSENVSGLLNPTWLQLTNLTTASTVPTSNIAVEYDLATNIAHFTFPGYANGVLPDGNYRGSILPGLPDFFGNGLAVNAEFDFFFLNGDANHDRSVNINDFAAVAANFNSPGTFSQGDFNYNGTVEIGDFSILAAKFNQILDPPAGSRPLAMPRFSSQPIGADREELIGLI
jgi:hypothetical protein